MMGRRHYCKSKGKKEEEELGASKCKTNNQRQKGHIINQRQKEKI